VLALWVAAHDRRTPWAARLVAGVTAAYALSPIDFIPDFIPVLGVLDDLLIVPAGVWLALRLIPAPLMAAYRIEAARLAERPRSWRAALLIVAVWLALAALAAWWLLQYGGVSAR
jgi:uncharacterized membrane protein YkvA (DUF1232 family)